MVSRLLKRLAASATAFGSLVILSLSLSPNGVALSTGQKSLIALSIALVAIDFGLAVYDYLQDRPTLIKRNKKFESRVNKYMQTWLQKGGRTAVFTRDMTWAEEPTTLQVLQQKAERGELVLCLPVATDMSRLLEDSGAEVYTYERVGLEPASRFTVINYGKGGNAEVAIGYTSEGVHRIDELKIGDHPAAQMSHDLVALVESLPASAR